MNAQGMRAPGLAALLTLATMGGAAAQELATYVVLGDSIAEPLTAQAGDAVRGRAIVANRAVGLCILCHTAPIPEERLQGNLAPDLAGAGARSSPGQLRLRLVDPARLNKDTIMPSYYRLDRLERVAKGFADKPILTAQQIEDVVAYLATLKEPAK